MLRDLPITQPLLAEPEQLFVADVVMSRPRAASTLGCSRVPELNTCPAKALGDAVDAQWYVVACGDLRGAEPVVFVQAFEVVRADVVSGNPRTSTGLAEVVPNSRLGGAKAFGDLFGRHALVGHREHFVRVEFFTPVGK